MNDYEGGSAKWPRKSEDTPSVAGTAIYGQYRGGTITPEERRVRRIETYRSQGGVTYHETNLSDIAPDVEIPKTAAVTEPIDEQPTKSGLGVLLDALLATRLVRWLLGE